MTAKQRRALEMLASGMSGPEIARELGVSRNYARNVAYRRGLMTPHKLRQARLWDRAYNAQRDLAASLDACYEAVRDRVAAGGEPWRPKELPDEGHPQSASQGHPNGANVRQTAPKNQENA